MAKYILQLKNIHKSYHRKNRPDVPVLKSANLNIEIGERVGLIGPSGSGKSTLLHIVGLLDDFDKGQVKLASKMMTKASSREKARMRLEALGFVYQFHHLLPELTALENIMMPQFILGVSKKQAKARAEALLEMLNISDRASHFPNALSGGEQQRVAIARALANKPRFLLADEPTGNLDPHTADEVFKLFNMLVKEEELSLLLVTHNKDLSKKLDRVVTIKDGEVVKG